MELQPPVAPVAPKAPTYDERLMEYQQKQLPESYTDHVAQGIRAAYGDEFDFSGMSPQEIVEAHHARFGSKMDPRTYQEKLNETYGQGWVAPAPPQTDEEIANAKHLGMAKDLAVGAAPYVGLGVGNMLAAAAKWGEHAVPVAGQIAAAAGHGINMLAQRGEAERMSAEANKVSDQDLSALASDFYAKAAPGLLEKGYTPEQIKAWTLHRAANVIHGGVETAASMNEGVNEAMKQEAAGALADVATFGVDTANGQALLGAARQVGRRLVGGALEKLGIDSVTRGLARAAVNPLVTHGATGAVYGGVDMGIRSAVEKAHDDAIANTPIPQLAYDTVVAGGKGAATGAAFGAALGAGIGVPLEAAGNKLGVAKALKEHLANGGTKEDFVPPKPETKALPFEPKKKLSEIPNTSPIESRPGQLRPATAEEAAMLRRFTETAQVAPGTEPAKPINFDNTVASVNPLTMEVPPGTEADVARGIIASKHGPSAANSLDGMRAADAIANKIKLYNDANAEMALHAGTGVGGDVVAPVKTPEGTAPPEPVAPATSAPVPAGPVLGAIERGGQLPEPLAPQGETVLPGRAPLAPVRPIPPDVVPPGIRPEAVPAGAAGGEAPIMHLRRPEGGEPQAFGERNLTAPAAAAPSVEQLAEGWSKELGFQPKKARAKAAPKPTETAAVGSSTPEGGRSSEPVAPAAGSSLSEVQAAAKAQIAPAPEKVPVEVKPEGIHVGVPIGDATSADVHAALDAAVAHADKAGLPITMDLTRVDAPQGGRIPVEKQLEAFTAPRGFRVIEETRSPEGQIQTARVRRDAIPPPKGGVLEAQGTMFERLAKKSEAVSKAAGTRLNAKLGRVNTGFDPTMIGDAALEMTGAMFARGLRGADAMSKYLIEKYGEKVAPHVEKIIALAQKHFMRFFKSEEGATKGLQDLLDLHESGKYGMGWYEKTADWAKKSFGPDADMFLRFLAVTSANGQTESGAALALKAFTQWKAGLKFTGMRGPSMTGQLERIARGENLGDFTKIENFYRALKGDPNAVVLDRWMLRALGIRNQSALSPSNYKLYDAAVKHLAQLNDMTPRQLQAAIWEGARVGNILDKERIGGRAASSKTGSARPLEDLVDKKLGGMSMDEYIGKEGGHLRRMQNIYDALAPVRKGEAFGHTFNLDTMEPDTKKGFVVSLVSTNVPKNSLYPGRVEKVLGRVQPLIDHLREQGLHPTFGVFARKLHPGQFSIDLNVTLADKARALAIGTENRQESIAQLGKGGKWIENIPTNWNKKGKQFLPPADGRLHREWYAEQINRVKRILKENP